MTTQAEVGHRAYVGRVAVVDQHKGGGVVRFGGHADTAVFWPLIAAVRLSGRCGACGGRGSGDQRKRCRKFRYYFVLARFA